MFIKELTNKMNDDKFNINQEDVARTSNPLLFA